MFAATRPERTRALILIDTIRIGASRGDAMDLPRDPGRAAGALWYPSWVRITPPPRSTSPAGRKWPARSNPGWGSGSRSQHRLAVDPVDAPAGNG